jgi:hypothetical protein
MPYGRFLFLCIDAAEPGRLWLQKIIDTITTAQPWSQSPPSCVNVGFIYNGLKVLGLAQASLDTYEYVRDSEIPNTLVYSAYPDNTVKEVKQALRTRKKFEDFLEEFQS